MNKLSPTSSAVLAAFKQADGHPIPKPPQFPQTIWRSALRRLRQRGYRIDTTWVGRNDMRYQLKRLGQPLYTPDEARVRAMFSDYELDIIADIVRVRLINQARGVAS